MAGTLKTPKEFYTSSLKYFRGLWTEAGILPNRDVNVEDQDGFCQKMLPIFVNIETEAGYLFQGGINQYWLVSLGKSFECGVICGAGQAEDNGKATIEGNLDLLVKRCGEFARTTLRQNKHIGDMQLLAVYSRELDWLRKYIKPYWNLDNRDEYVMAAMQANFLAGMMVGKAAVER